MNEETPIQQQATPLPLWKRAFEDLEREGLDYGKEWPAEWFEERLRCSRQTSEFEFSLWMIRDAILFSKGMYLEQCEGGRIHRIPSAQEHSERVAERYRNKVVTNQLKAVAVMTHLLANPNSGLSDEQLLKCEGQLEKDQKRLSLLVRRSKLEGWLEKKKLSLPPSEPPEQ